LNPIRVSYQVRKHGGDKQATEWSTVDLMIAALRFKRPVLLAVVSKQRPITFLNMPQSSNGLIQPKSTNRWRAHIL
jgi:hypothetical protein